MGNSKKEKELSSLVIKRDNIVDQLYRFQSFFESFTISLKLQLPDRIKKCESLWDVFEDVQSKIESLLEREQDLDSQIEIRKNFETKYFDTLATGRSLLTDNKTSEQNCNQVANTQQIISQTKLPLIEIPKFNGSYDQWVPFYDMFLSLIHTNKSLSNIQKFYYLKGSLTGDAADVIHSLQLNDSNYDVALNLLKERFENKRLITNNYLKQLFDIPSLYKESPSQLRQFLDEIKKVLRILNVLEQPVESWDAILIYMLSNKLDPVTKREWESSIISTTCPNMNSFYDFLTKKCQLLETLEQSKQSSHKSATSTGFSNTHNKNSSSFYKQKVNSKTLLVSNKKEFACPFCTENHLPYYCNKLLALSVKDRIAEARKLKLCLNCLRVNHTTQDCRSGSCRKCGKKHSSILHIENNTNVTNQTTNTTTQSPSSNQGNAITNQGTVQTSENSGDQQASVCSSQQIMPKHNRFTEVLLSTARVYILDKQGKQHECRALLDSGSQSNFMTKELYSILQLPKQKINLPVVGITQSVTNVSCMTNATIYSRINSFNVNSSFLIVDKITENLPSYNINSNKLNIPEDILLADPTYGIPGKIDLLIGATIFWQLLSVGQVKFSNEHPIMQKTKLGWILSGPVSFTASKHTTCNLALNEIHQQLERFWLQEEINTNGKPICTKEEEKCENIFQETTIREKDGRFCVQLPMKEDTPKLGDSFDMAMSRFEKLEKKLNNNSDYKNLYKDFLEEYANLGHMSLVNVQGNPDHTNTYYLPHHGIFKASSTTSKLRVVFDASATTTNGVSLNDQLLIGGKIQDNLFDILIRFRQHECVMIADIEKMYRQINVMPNQRSLQRILWRTNPDDPIKIYELNTLTYGTASAPYLAVRCLKQIALDIEEKRPEASRIISNDFYMDDLITGTSNVKDLKQLKQEITNILSSYGFHLRKWLSNRTEILLNHKESNSNHLIVEDKVNKTLGIVWDSNADMLKYSLGEFSENTKITKRSILSAVAKIFDPLGLIGPTVIKAKILLQKLWQCNITWDESVPMDIYTAWKQIARQLQLLNDMRIPRLIVCPEATLVELHCFSDASEQAYGACIYARSVDRKGQVTVQLICAKSRVAPLKQISLPRLELCGALLVSRLAVSVIQALNISIASVTLWTDSTIVLCWLAAEPTQWKTFVANRVTEIQELTSKYKWRHIRSNQNPADIISRGLNPEQLENCIIWWQGPAFLQTNHDQWPVQEFVTHQEIPEKRKTQTYPVFNNITFFTDLFQRYSSLSRLQRLLAYCLRFASNARKRVISDRNLGCLTVEELDNSLKVLVRACQESEFSNEINSLKKHKIVTKSSKLLSLHPFLDTNNLLRVGGRLSQSNLEFDQKYPMILPKNHILTKLIILDYHYRYLHSGPQALLAIMRLRFWPISGRNTIRYILNKCIVCFKNKPRNTIELMGDLPSDRITPCRPFSICGIDFAGPFKVKTSKLKGHKVIKAYMCIFVCFVTKAVHIEIVSDLSTDAFLNCFKRFISRRGLCSKIYSDNATNFIGANKELQNLYNFFYEQRTKSTLTDYLTKFHISWKFIPPRSPHFGGLWESAVKSAKYHIKRVVGETILTFEELYTVFTQIESCLNSRPLIPLTENPDDLQVLTPSHFLIGTSLAALPQPNLTLENTNRLNRYQLLTQILQNFWSKWSREYLTSLQPRSKWRSSNPVIQPGTMVLLREENLPPTQWLLGRVVEVFKGNDGKVRVVNVKTTKGIFKRAITKLSVLPIETSEIKP